MANLTLAVSNPFPRFGSPNRPRLEIVRPASDALDSRALRLFSSYLHRERRASVNTIPNYLNDVRQFEQWLAGKALEHATRDDIQNYIRERMDQGLSPRSAQRKLSVFRMFYRLLLDEELITFRPTVGVPLPKAQKKLPKCLSVEDVERIIGFVTKEKNPNGNRDRVRDKAIVLTLFASGLRASELINLKLADVDLQNGFIRVWNGKGGKDGIAPLSPPAVEALTAYIRDLRPKHDPERKCPYVFLTYMKGPLSRQALFHRLRKIGRQALGKDITVHQFRHACATALLKGGADIRDVQAILRHSNVDTTQIYLHTDITYLRGIYDKCHPRA